MPEITSSTEVSLTNNPAIIKDLYRQRLSKTQLHKNTFFKFLLQAGVPFTPKRNVHIPTVLHVDRLMKKYVSKGSTPTKTEYKNLNKIGVACRLDDIYIDNRPVFVEIRFKKYEEMSNGERNRLLALQSHVNLITFFHDDFEKVGLNYNPDAPFIRSMSKKVLKRWANLLFTKIKDLEGEAIEIPYSLIDLKANIDENASDEGDILKDLKKKHLNLRKRILTEHVSSNFGIQTSHHPIISKLLEERAESLGWIDTVLQKITEEFVFSIDFRKNCYKALFTQKNGKVNPMNKTLFTDYIMSRIERSPGLYAYVVEDNLIEIGSYKTLQSFFLFLNVTESPKFRSVTLNKDFTKTCPQNLIFTLTTQYDKLKRYTKPVEVTGGVILTNKSRETYTRNFWLTLFKSDRTKETKVEWAV